MVKIKPRDIFKYQNCMKQRILQHYGSGNNRTINIYKTNNGSILTLGYFKSSNFLDKLKSSPPYILKMVANWLAHFAKSETSGMYKLSLRNGLHPDVPCVHCPKDHTGWSQSGKSKNPGEYAFKERIISHFDFELLQEEIFDGNFHIGFGLHHSVGYVESYGRIRPMCWKG